MTSLVVSPIEDIDIPEISLLYTLSFNDNPCYSSIFPNYSDDDKHRALKWFFNKRLDIAKSVKWTMLKVKSTSTGKIVGACCAIPPGGDSTLMDNIIHGILMWPCYWGFSSFNALLHLMKLTKHYEGWELSMMAIHPDSQGQGVGHILLKEILNTIKARSTPGKEIVIHLATQKERNLRFYEKAGGFTTLCQERFNYYHLPEEFYPSWTMKVTIPN